MAEIRPFKAVKYNLQNVDIKKVTAPPYDVISEKQQDELYKISDKNIVRLILGKEIAGDDDINNKYKRASEFYQKWQDDKTLIQEDKEAIYIYMQDFEFDSKKYTRTGFLCLLKQEPLFGGTIYPHERTLSKPKADRLNLTRACKTNFSPIFGLYNDNGGVKQIISETIKNNPEIDFYDENNERHRLWIVKDDSKLSKIVSELKDKKIFIADGHHRYETAMNYAKEMKEQGIDGNFNFVLTFLCDMDDKGLAIFPTHRVVNDSSINLEKFMKDLEQYFVIQKSSKNTIKSDLETEYNKKNIAFGLYNGNDCFVLVLKDKAGLKNLINGSEYYRELDVAVLESLIFEKILNFSKEDIAEQKHLKYIKDFSETIEAIDSKKFNLAFIMNPTRIEQIKNVSLAGEVMPQKSTYFYPKLLTGLVLNKFEVKK